MKERVSPWASSCGVPVSLNSQCQVKVVVSPASSRVTATAGLPPGPCGKEAMGAGRSRVLSRRSLEREKRR
ncbi:MAG: hypothetical protein BWY99_02912 [Synergistetes bacterium ADurb.BinA166]|nr:MAG: hypothetical protein BWY99_02912 [Synergistetes bacterium ADurb.BinA166]